MIKVQSALTLGAIVRHTDGDRGVVIKADGRGLARALNPLRMTGDVVIERDHGFYRITNIAEGWSEVPESETTAAERVLSITACYEPPSWLEPGETPQDMDTFAAGLLVALLTSEEHAAVFTDYHYPTSLSELAGNVAECLDRRQKLKDKGTSK